MREEQGTGKKQILVIEDESLIAADLQKHLEKMGCSLGIALSPLFLGWCARRIRPAGLNLVGSWPANDRPAGLIRCATDFI